MPGFSKAIQSRAGKLHAISGTQVHSGRQILTEEIAFKMSIASSAGILRQWLPVILVLGWIVGLLLLACFPRLPLRPRFPFAAKSGNKQKRILLLVAHPDDECMFFGPTLLSLTMQPALDLRVFSISSGNADGLGESRKLEMLSSCAVLKVPAKNVRVLDHPSLQDGHSQEWDQRLLVEIIKETVEAQQIDSVITFDSYGVSGHPNHSALSRALRSYLLGRNFMALQNDIDIPTVEGWELVSLNIVRKYSGLLEICLSTLGWLLSRTKTELFCLVTPNPFTSVAAMKQHKSQWVWFRKLFVVFAAYTYVNTLRRIYLDASVASNSR